MSASESTFYVTGGTLRHDAPSYVERQADKDLLDGLLKGEFCYVLTSRQMGKSSLMVRTASKLRDAGVTVVVLDLTAIGQNLTPEQWYDGLLVRLGRQLDLEDELEEYWEKHRQVGPCQRLFAAVRDVVLPRVSVISNQCSVISAAAAPNTDSLTTSRLVLFVDELDVVRSLPFSTDEFFAAIRECYNRRTEDAEFDRLTFCLLGVASPGDLIRDTRTTPFNIGRRIELNDFTEAEAAPLATGLTNPKLESQKVKLLLQRVLYWTNGHPYLTQRLCHSIAGDGGVTGPASVDRLCETLFLSARARERDDNLLFVRERLLKSEVDLASLLHVYEDVRAQKRVRDDEANPLIALLRLSGVARIVEGYLWVRNRIYFRVFDREWVRINMPDAEVRRQRAALIKGVIRTAGLAVVVVAIVVSLAVSARRQADRAERSLYGADMILAQQALEASNLGEARQFLEKYRPSYSRFGLGFSKNDLRGWEWRYLWTLCRSDELATLGKQQGSVGTVAFSPDGHALASADHKDGAVRLWKLESPGQFATLPHPHGVWTLAYSPSGTLLATGADDGTVRIWDLAAKQTIHSITNAAHVASLRFSPDGKFLAVGPRRGPVKLWEVQTWREIASLPTQISDILSVGMAFTADSKTFAYGSADGRIVLWDVPTRSPITTLTGHTRAPMSLQFSRDGSTLVSAADEPDNTVKAWNVPDRQLITNVAKFGSWVGSVAFSPDERFVAAASADQKIKLFETSTWKEIATLKGHLDEVWSIAFSPDGKTLASGSKDKTVRLWSAAPKSSEDYMPVPSELESIRLSPQGDVLLGVFMHSAPRVYDAATLREIGQFRPRFSPGGYLAISPRGQLLAASDTNGAIKLWDAVRQIDVAILQTGTRAVHRLAFSPDGRMLAAAGADGRIELWDVATTNRFPPFVTRYTGRSPQMRLSRDGTLLALCGGPDNAPEIWSIARREKVAKLIGHDSAVNDIALTGDNQTAATASWDGYLKLWDVNTRKELASFHGQLRGYRCVTISPDDRRVAAGGSDGVIEIWDINTRQAVARLKGHKGHVLRAAFLPDNNTLVSVGEDGVRLWRALSLKQIDTEEKTKPHQK